MSTGNVEPMQLSLEHGRESGIVDVAERATVEREASSNPGSPNPGSSNPGSSNPGSSNPGSSNPGSPVTGSPVTGSPVTGSPVTGSPVTGSPVTNAVEPEKTREQDIDIDTDLSDGKLQPPPLDAKPTLASGLASDDGVIEVADDDIETADEAPPRHTQSSLPAASGVLRSRPPARPSARPRSEAGGAAALPPPLRFTTPSSLVGPASSSGPGSVASSLPPPSSRNGPWALANKTLELSRANAYIVELEELVAFRDARIITLEERLQAAYARLDGLEQRLGLGVAAERPVPRVATNGNEVASASAVKQNGASGPKPAQGSTSSEHRTVATWSEEDPEGLDSELDDDSQGAEADSKYARANAGSNALASALGEPAGAEEDLRIIAGIGPRFEAALRKHGVTRLSQIASWSDADVRLVAKALKIPKSRIVKGRWVESAREAIGTRPASE
jgi:predicted flap endonuclease-1-like 5' DNA nuclease